jgi:sugar/nucleoside kinase (ribokinase family)
MRAICIGQAAYDITLPMDHFPIENKKMRTSNKVECAGGSACNCAYLLAKWGMETYFAGVVGDDYYGEKIKNELNEIGVNTKYLEIGQGLNTTSSYIVTNTTSGSRTIITNRPKELMLRDVVVDEKFDVILLDGYEREFANKIINDNPSAIKIIDAGSLKEATIELSKKMDYVVCSKDFAEEYTKRKVDYNDLTSLIYIYKLLKKDFEGNIIITLEDKGCFVYDNGYKLVPTIKRKAVDSTGAGDIFHGAFTYAVANNFDMIKTLKIANISGALSVTKIGGQHSIPTYEDVIEKYNECTKQG